MSFHKVTLLGRLGADAKLTSNSEKNKSYADINVATDTYAGKDDEGKSKYTTDWWSVRIWGAQAEFVAKNAKKGSTVYVEGELTINVKDDQSGNQQVYRNIRGQVVQIAAKAEGGSSSDGEPKPSGASSNGAARSSSNKSNGNGGGRAATQTAVASTAADVADAEPEGSDDDDFPF